MDGAAERRDASLRRFSCCSRPRAAVSSSKLVSLRRRNAEAPRCMHDGNEIQPAGQHLAELLRNLRQLHRGVQHQVELFTFDLQAHGQSPRERQANSWIETLGVADRQLGAPERTLKRAHEIEVGEEAQISALSVGDSQSHRGLGLRGPSSLDAPVFWHDGSRVRRSGRHGREQSDRSLAAARGCIDIGKRRRAEPAAPSCLGGRASGASW